MFRLESYVTPILLEHVAKYVKNFRPEDAQLSLWEGEVTLLNLDLELDVLEDELKLPIDLVSGHVHELTIQVPWTKLTSEPIRIIIDTIEFVVKLPDEKSNKARAERRAASISNADAEPVEEEQAQGPGISSNLVNKIINNICLECRNIIFKYVDDDIVVSMNIQHLSAVSANDKWEPAMVDATPVSVFMRKLVQVSDLTICLDQRNTAGRVDVCQEPILYRCTLECRFLRKFNVSTVKTSSTIRVGVLTKSLDINVSSLTFPLVMRLVKLATEFSPPKPDAGSSKPPTKKAEKPPPPPPPDTNAESQPAEGTSRGSMLSWAWNLLPSFETSEPFSENDPIGHALDIGLYIEALNFQLKNSELFTDHVMNIKRIRYTPIMRVSLGGLYFERSQLPEGDWANMRAGLSSINMEPLGYYRSEGAEVKGFVTTNEKSSLQTFIDKSLFDHKYMYADRTWFGHNYDDYYKRHTDEYMVHRSPVLAFDVVEYRAPSQAIAKVPPEQHLQDLGLRVKYRLLSAGITFHFSQSFLQVKNVISDILRPYDYTGYYAAHSEVIQPVNKEEEYRNEYMTSKDFKYLHNVMPVCNYRIDLRNITIKFFPRRQSAYLTAGSMHRLSTTVEQSQLPHLQFKMAAVVGSICGPAKPKRLVKLITHLEDKPKEVVDTCYTNYQLSVKNFTVSVLNTTIDGCNVKLMNIPSMQVNFNRLLLPYMWRENIAPLDTAEILAEVITIEGSKREFIVVTDVIKQVIEYEQDQLNSLLNNVAHANKNSDVIKLQTMITKFRFKYHKYHTHMSFLTSIRNLNTDVFHTVMNIRNVVISTNKGYNNKWFELQLQFPLIDKSNDSDNQKKEKPATAICLWLDKFRVTLDVYLLQFFNSFINCGCSDTELETDSETVSEVEKVPSFSNISLTSAALDGNVIEQTQSRPKRPKSRKVSNPAETIHVSSERDEKPPSLTPQRSIESTKTTTSRQSINRIIDILSCAVVLVDISRSRINVCDVMLRGINESSNNFTSIRLPVIKVKTSHTNEITRGNIQRIIYENQSSETCNWIIEMMDFGVTVQQGNKTENIIAPIQMTITLAESKKMDFKHRKNGSLSKSSTRSTMEEQHTIAKKKVDWKNVDTESEASELEQTITYSVNVHVDISEIIIYGRCFKLLKEHYGIIYAIYMSICFSDAKTVCNETKRNSLNVVTGSAHNVPIIKEFLELDPDMSSFGKDSDAEDASTLIIFCQLTIPRISMEMESNVENIYRKIVLNFEDLLLNVDKHPDFTKITTKVEHVNLNYYEGKHPAELEIIDSLQFKMLGDSSNLPMISVVVTTVSLKDLYTKIGARNLDDKSRTISEILIDLQPIEIILDIALISEFLIGQCELLEVIGGQDNPTFEKKDQAPNVIAVKDLPMVHLNSKGVYIYLPMEEGCKTSSTLLLMQVESIKLSPSVENPLVRNPIRQDIYNKAAELNMLSTPGALVEDRQYELSVRKISLSTGNWKETQQYRLENLDDSTHNNPAFEWNNQPTVTELKQMIIFKDFDFITIYAPAMTYDRFLVSGELIEYNCVTDFVATLNTHQMLMMLCIMDHAHVLSNLLITVCERFASRQTVSLSEFGTSSSTRSSRAPSNLLLSLQESKSGSSKNETIMYGSCNSDSGINLAKNILNEQKPEAIKPRHKYTLPRSVSFVAGQFSMKIFDVIDDLKLKPLSMITISQPSYFFTKTMSAEITQASVFDLNISLSKNNEGEEFSQQFFDTMPITMGTSGIPSSLLTIKAQVNRNNQMEVDVNLGKPILICLCESSVMNLLGDFVRVYTVLNESPYFGSRNERPVVTAPPLRLLKQYCFNADRLNMIFNQVTIKFYNASPSFDCKAVFMDFNALFNARSNKATIKSTLGTFFVQVGDQIMLHPILIRMSTDLLSESWCDQLMITSTLKLNMLHVDASITSVLQLQNAQRSFNHIMKHVNQSWEHFMHHRIPYGVPYFQSRATLRKFMPTPGQIVHSKVSQKPKTEFYQDDLRAGAFQFVDLTTDTMLPMPYQVQIIKKKYGIICWRYPQPRQMNKIFISPVPMPVDNPIHIKCRMEYFSEPHETFLHYCDFLLSESNTKILTLPDRNICANIWRVIIMQSLISVDVPCFEQDTDEELQSIDSSRMVSDFKQSVDNDFILHPKVLVGCMRIDTKFNPELVPKLQLLLSCQSIEVNLFNHPSVKDPLPPRLSMYHTPFTRNPFAFLTIQLEGLKVHTGIHSATNYTLEMNFRSRIKCLDNTLFNMLDVLEPTSFHGYLQMNKQQRILNANILMDKLRFNCGPWVTYTLLCSKQHWLGMMQKEMAHAMISRCVIVNRLEVPLSFGQTGTSERIHLASHELHFYYFASDYHGQELTFFIENPETKEVECSQSMHITLKFDELYRVSYSRIGNRCITVKECKLSSSQMIILIKGQIEVISFVPYSLYAEFCCEDKKNANNADQLPNTVAHFLKEKCSFYQIVQRNADINMRLKLPPDEGKGRTGDIPLKPNTIAPWLVKVPTQSPQQFISLWVRILREDIALDKVEDGFQPQKILVCIWPVFEVCNRLSCYVKTTDAETKESFDIPAQGGRRALSTATTHSTEHPMQFEYPCVVGKPTTGEYKLMLKTMDCQKFFQYDPVKWTIESALTLFRLEPIPEWPNDDPEELAVRRNIKQLDNLDVQYRVRARQEFSCTQQLEISAWGVFINATGVNVGLCLPKFGIRYDIEANSLAMLPQLLSHFTIDVSYGSNWVSSKPICLDKDIQSALSASGGGRHNVLSANSVMDIVVVINDEVFRMLLEYKLDDGKRMFKLRSKFVIANFSDTKIYALPLTMDHKETSTRETVNSLDNSKKIRLLLPMTSKQTSLGNTIELFHDLNASKRKHTSDTAFVYFVSIAVSGSLDVSIPIPLAMPFTRRCFSVQNGAESIPLMITLIEKDNVYYLNVFKDTAPAIMINNNTNVKFIVAQTSASGNSNVTCTQSEFAAKHFDWYQLVMPHSKCYYTPPKMYANFPDVEFTMCNLSLAIYTDPCVCSAKSRIGWSKPIRMDQSWKKFMHIPNHGDIKVVICDKHRVIQFNIYYIAQQLEFSVKDLRSRLTEPEQLTDRDENVVVIDAVASEAHKMTDEDSFTEFATECIHFKEECNDKTALSLRVFIKSFVFSLQTNNPDRDYLKTEVCNMYMDDVVLAYDDNEDQRQFHLQLPNLQVDNQLYSSGKYDFPVLLCSQQLYQRNCHIPQVYDLDAVYRRQAEEKAVSLLTFTFYEDEMQLQSGRCQLQPLRVYIEDAYLNQLLDTLVECESSNSVYTPPVPSERICLEVGETLLPSEVVAQALYISEPLRLNSFVVEPLSLLLSVHTSSRLYIALDHSPLSFSRYERHQILTVPLRFGQNVGLHYLSGAIFGAGWVVGSLEILGSPSGLARSFSTGLRDFIAMPVEGLFRGPWGFLVGVTQGSASLMRNVTAGTVNSVTKLAGSVARNLDRLTLDSEHIELTEARRRARPQGFADGLTQGLTGLGISLLGAVGGLAHHTLEARSSVGVLTGLTKGIVGALTKPISGAAEMLALTGQGVLHTVGFNTMPLQVEPSITRNVALHTSSHRIWRYMPEQLMNDQILFFQEITLIVEGHMHPALLFVTSTVLVIMERQREELAFYSAVLKVEAVADRDDPSKLYLSLRPENDETESENYKNERIMNFLNASRTHILASDKIDDLLTLNDLDNDYNKYRKTECEFYIRPNLGEHLIQYLKVIRQTH